MLDTVHIATTGWLLPPIKSPSPQDVCPGRCPPLARLLNTSYSLTLFIFEEVAYGCSDVPTPLFIPSLGNGILTDLPICSPYISSYQILLLAAAINLCLVSILFIPVASPVGLPFSSRVMPDGSGGAKSNVVNDQVSESI